MIDQLQLLIAITVKWDSTDRQTEGPHCQMIAAVDENLLILKVVVFVAICIL